MGRDRDVDEAYAYVIYTINAIISFISFSLSLSLSLYIYIYI